MKKLLMLSALGILLVACGQVSTNPTITPTTTNTTTIAPSESQTTTINPTTVAPTTTPTPTTVTPTTTAKPTTVAPTTVSTTQTPTSTPSVEDLEAARYAYQPLIDDVVPEIKVTTNTNLDFATKPDRLNKWDYTDCSVEITNCNEEYELSNVTGGIKVRGNYTANYAKKPFRFKFDEKVNMLGLNEGAKAKSWVLLADWKDSSMTRNAISFFLGKTVLESDGFYSSDFRPVHLYLNNEYWGMYLLAEQQQVNKYRVNMEEPDDDYEGTDIGYLFEYDGYYYLEKDKADGDPVFEITYNNHAPLTDIEGNTATPGNNKFSSSATMGYTIKSDITHQNQLTFIRDFTENLYNLSYEAVYNQSYKDLNSTYNGLVNSSSTDVYSLVSKYIDLQSLVDMYIISEIACDLDVAWSSFYMALDMSEKGSKKLTFCAPWDFDSAFGLINGRATSGRGYFASKRENANSINPWLAMFAREDWFVSMLKEKWSKVVKYNIHGRALDLIDTYKEKYADDYARNFTRWPSSMGSTSDSQVSTVGSFTKQAEASEFFRNWLKIRLNFCNEIWGDASDLFYVPIKPIEGYEYHRFELENSTLAGGPTVKTDETASEGKYVSGVGNNNGCTITTNVNSTKSQKIRIYLGLSRRPSAFHLETQMSLTINNQNIPFSSDLIEALRQGAKDYHDWDKIYVVETALAEGTNTITLKQIGSNGTNLDYLEIYASENSVN